MSSHKNVIYSKHAITRKLERDIKDDELIQALKDLTIPYHHLNEGKSL